MNQSRAKSAAKKRLEQCRDEIFETWAAQVRRLVPTTRQQPELFLQRGLSALLDELGFAFDEVDKVANESWDPCPSSLFILPQKCSFPYTLDEVLKEFEVLHDTLIAVLDRDDDLSKLDLKVIRGLVHRATQKAAAAFTDIQHTADLSKERDFLSAILDNLAEGVVACDAEGVLTLFNRSSREIHGLPEIPIPADQWADYYSLYHADGCTPLRMEEIPLFRALQGENVQSAEIVIAPKGAPVRVVLGSGRALKDRDGAILGAVVAMYDVTTFKAAEETRATLILEQAQRVAAERSERATAQILERISDAFFALDADWCFTYVNNQAEMLLGRQRSALLGKNIWNEFPDTLGNEFERECRRAVDEQCAVSLEAFYPQLDGWFRVKVYPSPNGLTVYFENVTTIHRAREELEQARTRAENATKAKSAFLANMSHEIRTPLGVILGFSEFILDPQQTTPDRIECIHTIRRNAEQLFSLINELLDLSKIEADRLEIEHVPFKLDELIQDVHKLLGFHAREKGIRLNLISKESLQRTLVTDPMRLRQILINVIGNAIKFTEQGSVDVIIEARWEKGGRRPIFLTFTVRDTGIGLSAEQAQRIWEPFMQADNATTRKFGGTGLGLSLSRKLANALGGDLILSRSEVGVGSTFTITIEAGVEDSVPVLEAAMAKAAASVGEKAVLRPLTGVQVLLAEDSSDNQILVKRILNREGAFVDIAGDGEEGVAKAMAGTYDLVLMDVQMPLLDGYGATARLRKQGFRMPIIALTAHAMKGERERAIAHGFDDHLTKPIDRKILVEKVKTFCQGR